MGRVMVIVTMIMNARDPWFVEITTVISKIHNRQKKNNGSSKIWKYHNILKFNLTKQKLSYIFFYCCNLCYYKFTKFFILHRCFILHGSSKNQPYVPFFKISLKLQVSPLFYSMNLKPDKVTLLLLCARFEYFLLLIDRVIAVYVAAKVFIFTPLSTMYTTLRKLWIEILI